MQTVNPMQVLDRIDSDMPFAWLGRQPYEPMWRQLRERAECVAENLKEEIIWCCEHAPVYTTGKRGIDNSLLALPAPFVHTDRGGETTFHGPGQVMLYPVLHLRHRGLSAKAYLHLIEQSCIDLLAGFGVIASRRCEFPGVWLDEAKIAAVGLRIHRGVAYHGMALNVDVDPQWFAAIRPCGLSAPVANLADHIARTSPLADIAIRWNLHLNRLLEPPCGRGGV